MTVLRADVHDDLQSVFTKWRDTAKGVGETEAALVYRDALSMLVPALADTDDDALAFLNDLSWRFEDGHARNFMDPSADTAWERVKRRHAMLTGAVLREQTSAAGVCQSLTVVFERKAGEERDDARTIWLAAARHLATCEALRPTSAAEMLVEMAEWTRFMKSRDEYRIGRPEVWEQVLAKVVETGEALPNSRPTK
ncbi:hypothetical protein [Aeromicrobium sp. 179-A 4D2 NHS]|uniref:hypothetical protein n=1 Tax=Aeromicrobium sp. 179-A 4D2 NHS TaxID=3142375 RepID=UPI0039A3A34A